MREHVAIATLFGFSSDDDKRTGLSRPEHVKVTAGREYRRSQHGSARSDLDGGYAAAVQHDESVSVSCAKRTGGLCELGDDVFDDLIDIGGIGFVVCEVHLVAAGETDA